MPGLGESDVGTAGTIRPAHAGGNRLDDGSVAALLGRDLLGIALSGVLVAVGKLGCGNRRQYEARAKMACESGEEARAQARHEGFIVHAGGGELLAPPSG